MGYLLVNRDGDVVGSKIKQLVDLGNPVQLIRLNADVTLGIYREPLNDGVVIHVYNGMNGVVKLTKVFDVTWPDDVYSEEQITNMLLRTVICSEDLMDRRTSLGILKQAYPHRSLACLVSSLDAHGFSACLRGFVLAKSDYNEGIQKVKYLDDLNKFNSDEDAALAAKQLGFPICEDKEHHEFLVTTKIERNPAALLLDYAKRYKEIAVNSNFIMLDDVVIKRNSLPLFEFCLKQFADLSFVQTTRQDYVSNVEIGESDFVLRVNYGEDTTFYFTKL